LGEVQRGLSRLKNHKAAGLDNMPAEVLKYSGAGGVRLLRHLFNAVYEAECIPSSWRQGVVTHLPKGGDSADCSNYRLLTLMPVIDKLFANL